MKTCPICNAKAFDDMDVCYGCLHRFDERRPSAPSGGVGPNAGDGAKGVGSSREDSSHVREGDEPPAKGESKIPEIEAGCGSPDMKCGESDSGDKGGKMFVINVPLPQGVKGVRVAVDFDISGDPCA